MKHLRKVKDQIARRDAKYNAALDHIDTLVETQSRLMEESSKKVGEIYALKERVKDRKSVV